MATTEKVLLTVTADHPLWLAARADAGSAMLPFACREIIEGNVGEVVLPATEWLKLQSYLRSLPGGTESLPFAVADAPAPAKPEATDRAIAARKLAEVVTALGAVTLAGGDVLREETGRYYAVPFGHGMFMSGIAFVYGPTYVRVTYTADTGFVPPNGLPRADSRNFGSVDAAAKFLTLCLHERKFAEALKLPLREPKRKAQS